MSSGRVFRITGLLDNQVFIDYLNEPLEPYYSSHYLAKLPEMFKKYVSAKDISILEECDDSIATMCVNKWRIIHKICIGVNIV